MQNRQIKPQQQANKSFKIKLIGQFVLIKASTRFGTNFDFIHRLND